ncbi:MAG: DegT/DnrJ/EryC1/StrS family aminotransferase [Phycisphaerales bacterium]
MGATASARKLAIDGGVPVSAETIPVVSARLEDDEIDAAVEVMRSGQLRQGSVCAEFESRFASMTGAQFALTTSNGTTALQLAYEPLFEPGDEVLCPGYTFIATVSMVFARGARPVLCEIDPDNFAIDPDDAEQRITDRTRAIAVTHLYGNPANIAAIEALAKRRGLKVIYDAAQSHLARYDGRGIGAFGDTVTYSFYPTKNMTTGEGGMVTTNDGDLARELSLVRDHGMEPGRRYHHVALGYNYRLNDVAAAIGLKQLDKLTERTRRRQRNAARLTERLESVDAVIPPKPTERAEHVYHQYTIRLNLDALRVDRDEFARALGAEGVGYALHYPTAVHEQPMVQERMKDDLPDLPVCVRTAREVLCLPVHPNLTDEQIDQITEAVAKVADAYAV